MSADGVDGSRSPREGDFLCTDCGTIHADNTGSCRNCSNDRFARVEPERAPSVDSSTSVTYRCKECGTTAPRNSTPCKQCGNPTFESIDGQIPTASPSEPELTTTTTNGKDPDVAALLSFLITGLGQAYNGDVTKGALLFGVQILNLVLIFFVIGLVTFPLVWGYGIYDAYTSARRPTVDAI